MEVKNENSYIKGTIGALLGALIATIPWILVYIYGNMMLSLLALIIGYCALYGYKLFKGKMDKKTPWIIAAVSIIAVTIATLVIIPLCLLYKEGYFITFNNLQILYGIADFRNAILRDFAVSILFTILGISGIITKMRQEVA